MTRHHGNGTRLPPVLMPQPRPKKRPRTTPLPQGEIASSRRRHELQLEAAFLHALAEHFAQHGQAAIVRVFNRSPEIYLRLCREVPATASG